MSDSFNNGILFSPIDIIEDAGPCDLASPQQIFIVILILLHHRQREVPKIILKEWSNLTPNFILKSFSNIKT